MSVYPRGEKEEKVEKNETLWLNEKVQMIIPAKEVAFIKEYSAQVVLVEWNINFGRKDGVLEGWEEMKRTNRQKHSDFFYRSM